MKGLGLLVSDENSFKYFSCMSQCKTSAPWVYIFSFQDYDLNNLRRDQLDKATYQIWKAWAF